MTIKANVVLVVAESFRLSTAAARSPRRAVAHRLALFIEREERRLADAFPFGGALARQCFETVGVIVEPKGTEARLQLGLKALLHARDERQNGLAPEGAIGLGVIAERIVAGQAQKQRRHAEGERDLARGAGFHLSREAGPRRSCCRG